MTLPKDKEETGMSTVRQPQPVRRGEASGPDAAAGDFGWRMPGGEDLLKFALSAGLVAGAWWMETRPEGEAPGASEDLRTACAGPGEKP